ncbi:MAG: hypothetical protein ACK46X_05165 [Candidatus Sericytochromatia bacterium]
MRSPLLLSALTTIVLAGCSYAPTPGGAAQPANRPASPASVTPASTPAPEAPATPSASCLADFDAFNVEKDTTLSYDEYVNGRWGQVRFIKAPTPAEEAAMKDGFRADARKADQDGDGKLTRTEFGTTCGQ